ncbi:MAG: GPR endopeptidase [Bacilli bacterium]|nr:GPR endopeptidase [Bacilli bacterium]
MHTINLSFKGIRTDLISDKKIKKGKRQKRTEKDILIEESIYQKNHYTTIFFKDITDSNHYQIVQNIFVKEFQKYLHLTREDKILIVGLGNRKSTPDSLGPKTMEHILVTRYLFTLGEVEDGYTSVAVITPDVMGNTGIETFDIIEGIIQKIDITKIILIDALKTNRLERLGKTIQITDYGMIPGSGLGNQNKEFSKATIQKDIIVIGIPTVVDLEEKKADSNYMVTPTNIDFLIEKFSHLLGQGINISLHRSFFRQNSTE